MNYRDKALFEFEKRVYNNIKVNAKVPLEEADIMPGAFRTGDYTYEQVQTVYSKYFLNWIGLNRINYEGQYFINTNEYTWNYSTANSKVDNKPLNIGGWRGLYLWFYDTINPHDRPWEMLGIHSKPLWWENRYGPAPYTRDNKILWDDLEAGYNYNNGSPYNDSKRARPGLSKIIPVDSVGNLVGPFTTLVSSYTQNDFKAPWKQGDVGPAEYAYLKSSAYPFDLMAMFASLKPAQFFALGLDLDVYQYNYEFKQYLVGDRYRTTPKDMIIYGSSSDAAAHSYMNWIVDYQRQFGEDGSQELYDLIQSLDVRLAYRLAGFSDKTMLNFSVEKGTPNSKNSSLLIPDESYTLIAYDNQPDEVITYSSVIVQKTEKGFKVFGNSQTQAYFKYVTPLINGLYDVMELGSLKVTLARDYTRNVKTVSYGSEFTNLLDLCYFMKGYGEYLTQQGIQFNDVENGLELNWNQMIIELMYWINTGWEVGSTVNINPCANVITVDKENTVVQPLTIHKENFILNQNLIPIQIKDMSVTRNETSFKAKVLNPGDAIAFFRANLSNIEHVVVFDNYTVFNDVIFNLVTGLRQQRIFVKGSKTADWNGTINAAGFILNLDNVDDWKENIKYTKGTIVRYKRNYYIANKVTIAPSTTFNFNDWIKTDYDTVQKGLLPNASNKAYESTLFYDTNRANLEKDGDLLGFSLIGYRPRDYLASGNMDDVAQVNVYKNMIPIKGTPYGLDALNGIEIQGNKLQYTFNENWAIKSSEFGGVMTKNFVEFTLDENKLTERSGNGGRSG